MSAVSVLFLFCAFLHCEPDVPDNTNGGLYIIYSF